MEKRILLSLRKRLFMTKGLRGKYIRIIALFASSTQMRKIALVFVIAFASLSMDLMAQDPQFSQFYANQLYLNPALAGSARCPRVSLNYRNQWPGIPSTYITYAAGYDQYVDAISGGIGIQAYHDRSGSGIIANNSISGMYAYQLAIDRNISLKAGFQTTYYQKSVDWSKLTWGDMIDERYGFIYPTGEIPIDKPVNKLDFSAGALLFTQTFYLGFATHHLTQPDESFFKNTESRLPRKYTAHGGALIPLDKDNPEDGSISPNIIYQRQGEFQQLNLGLYVNKGPITGGIWYRSKDALIFLVGLYTEAFRFGYSYDVTVSSLGTQTLGSHEISVTMMFPCKQKRRKFKMMRCPQF
jgi:type IX secretion system PorP/SprF family membrane protein